MSTVHIQQDDFFFFLYGCGTGKTPASKTLSTAIKYKGMIVLNVASRRILFCWLLRGKKHTNCTLKHFIEHLDIF